MSKISSKEHVDAIKYFPLKLHLFVVNSKLLMHHSKATSVASSTAASKAVHSVELQFLVKTKIFYSEAFLCVTIKDPEFGRKYNLFVLIVSQPLYSHQI